MLEKFNEMLVEANKKINLTGHKDYSTSWENNILDSLLFDFPSSGKVLDLGSGCGCPAIPLKIKYPDLDVTMIDSVRKKVDFLNEAVKELGLERIHAVHCRIEDFVCHPERAKRTEGSSVADFDIVTARAVAELPTLLEYAMPFLKIGGYLYAFKGINYQTEIDKSQNALKILNAEITEILQNENRYLLKIKKIKQTPKGYPRGKNLPRVKPL